MGLRPPDDCRDRTVVPHRILAEIHPAVAIDAIDGLKSYISCWRTP